MAIEVNGELISNADVRAEMAAMRAERERSGEEVSLEERLSLREEAVQALVERKLLLQEARRLGFTPSPEQIDEVAASLAPRGDGISGCRAGSDTDQLRQEAERRILMEALIDRWCSAVSPPKPAEVSRYFRDNRERFMYPEMVHASHIVKNFDGEDRSVQRERVSALRERLLAGEDFATVAAAESDCPERGGDLGWFARGSMVEEFDDMVFRAAPGELTGVFDTRFGAHVALVHACRPAGLASFDEVAESIQARLFRVKIDRETGKRVEALFARASIREIA